MTRLPAELRAVVTRLRAFYRKRVDVDTRALLAVERQVAAGVARGFQVQRLAVYAALQNGELQRAAKAVKATHPLDTVLDAIADPIYQGQLASYVLGANRASRKLGLDATFTLRSQRAERYARTTGAARIVGINAVTRERVQTIVSRGMANGLGPREIAGWIARDGVFSPTRAATIAVTETGEAYGTGNFQQTTAEARRLGLTVEKQWIVAGDPCPICAGNAGDGWIPADAAFSSGDTNEVAHPNCRCVCEYRAVQ